MIIISARRRALLLALCICGIASGVSDTRATANDSAALVFDGITFSSDGLLMKDEGFLFVYLRLPHRLLLRMTWRPVPGFMNSPEIEAIRVTGKNAGTPVALDGAQVTMDNTTVTIPPRPPLATGVMWQQPIYLIEDMTGARSVTLTISGQRARLSSHQLQLLREVLARVTPDGTWREMNDYAGFHRLTRTEAIDRFTSTVRERHPDNTVSFTLSGFAFTGSGRAAQSEPVRTWTISLDQMFLYGDVVCGNGSRDCVPVETIVTFPKEHTMTEQGTPLTAIDNAVDHDTLSLARNELSYLYYLVVYTSSR